MHDDVLAWAKKALPMEGKTLEVGSLNVNGTLRSVLPITWGIDIRPGKGVDQVLDACILLDTFGPESWDNVVTSSCFEHVEFWELALRNAWGVLKTGGKFLFEVPTLKKGYHAHPYDWWRWDVELLQQTFKDQDIIALEPTWQIRKTEAGADAHGVGCICRKVAELTYVQPHTVKHKSKERKQR